MPSDKQIKAAQKEGGKKAQDLAGMKDMGGPDFFSMTIDCADGDVELLKVAMEAANVEVDTAAEERKGGSGHIGKMFLSAGKDALALVAYVPQDKLEVVKASEWMEKVCKDIGGEVKEASDASAVGICLANTEKQIFPLKQKDLAQAMSVAFLRSKNVFPEDDDDDSEEEFYGDDAFDDL